MTIESAPRALLSVLFAAGLMIQATGWAAPDQRETADLVISNAKVISPPSTVMENATVIVTGGKIAYVGTHPDKVNSKRRIDAHRRALIPGLIDTHVHLNIDTLESEALYDEWIHQRAANELHDYLRHGFTTVQSLADYWPGIIKLREKLDTAEIEGPHLRVAGPMITPPYGHAAAYSPKCAAAPFCLQSGWYREVSTEEQARSLIRDLAAHHADGVKIANEPTKSPDGKSVGFSPGVLLALIEEAHRNHLRVYVHPASVDYAIEAIKTGADALAHGPGIELAAPDPSNTDNSFDPLVAIARERNIPISTTAGGWWDYLGPQKSVPLLRDIKKLFDAGIPLAFATDNVGGTIESMREFKTLAASGLTPMQILQVATVNAARHMGLEQEIGSIDVGKRADLVLVAADPLQSIQFLDRVDFVIKDGKVVFDYYAEGRALHAKH